jgi:WD40 repeat protein
MSNLINKFLILAFNITNPEYLRKIKKAWEKQLVNDTVVGRKQKETEIITSDKLGGKLVLLKMNKDYECSEVSKVKVRTPMGICLSKSGDSLFTGSDHWIYEIRNSQVVRKLNNPLFNCIHGISFTLENTLLVASTGVDAIIEINPEKPEKCLWSWFAPDHGFLISKNGGIRTLNYNKRLQCIEFSTPVHTTHVNSILQKNRNKILAVLFHQGSLVEIDKKTGKTAILLSGLKNPHGIKKRNNEYLICDTKGNRVFILDINFKIKKQISSNFNWVQDAIFTQEGNIILADSNNGRLWLWEREKDNLKIIYQYDPNQLRIGSIMEISYGNAIKVFRINKYEIV